MEGSLEVAAALLLVCAGVGKLRFPQPAAAMLRRAWHAGRVSRHATAVVRVVGIAETVFGLAALSTGNRATAIALALWYAAFTVVTVRLVRRAPATSCGCFGRLDSPVGVPHVVLNLACAAIASTAALRPPGRFGGLLEHGAWTSATAAAQAALLAYLGFLSITALPALTAARRRLEAR